MFLLFTYLFAHVTGNLARKWNIKKYQETQEAVINLIKKIWGKVYKSINECIKHV